MINTIKNILKTGIGALICFSLLCTYSDSAYAKKQTSKARSSKTVGKSGKSKKSSNSAKKTRKSSHRSGYSIQNLLNNPDSLVWVRKGKSGLITAKDSTGAVRAMAPASVNSKAARRYAETINRLADLVADENVRVYACPVPSQGDFYMPEIAGTTGNERKNIRIAAEALQPGVTMVFIGDTLANHTSEDIYNRTDHHWAPLGGYYGAKALAVAAGVPFRPLSDYKTVTEHDYIGTMYKFTGDPEINKYPEDFIYFLPPEGYEAEFIYYSLSNGHTVGEKEPVKGSFFKKASGGALYCVFMGGDSCTVKVTGTGTNNGRKLLIVKDSFGNAMPSNLFGSFEQVHVMDFRYFPHSLVKYIKDNGITDVAIVNAVAMALSPTWQRRYEILLDSGSVSPDDAEDEEDSEEEEEEGSGNSVPWVK